MRVWRLDVGCTDDRGWTGGCSSWSASLNSDAAIASSSRALVSGTFMLEREDMDDDEDMLCGT